MLTAIPPVIFTYIEGLKRHDVHAIAQTVSDDLAFVTPSRRLDKEQFLQMLRAIYGGFRDWHYRHDPPEIRDATVVVRWRQNGTHTGPFTLPGMAPIAPTGRAVEIPTQWFVYTVRDDKIIEIRPEPIAGGAPGGILQQIGVSSPPL